MLYLGNFSYSDANEQFDNICLMPAIVEAPDSDTALERFASMLRDLHDTSDLVDGAHDIYLDSLVELSESPTKPLLVQWQKVTASDDGLYSTLSTLPYGDGAAEAYAWEDGGLTEMVGEDEVEDLLDDVEGLADAIAEAFEALTSETYDEDALDQDEEAFLSFED